MEMEKELFRVLAAGVVAAFIVVLREVFLDQRARHERAVTAYKDLLMASTNWDSAQDNLTQLRNATLGKARELFGPEDDRQRYWIELGGTSEMAAQEMQHAHARSDEVAAQFNAIFWWIHTWEQDRQILKTVQQMKAGHKDHLSGQVANGPATHRSNLLRLVQDKYMTSATTRAFRRLKDSALHVVSRTKPGD